jgi:hypothetical protein
MVATPICFGTPVPSSGDVLSRITFKDPQQSVKFLSNFATFIKCG